MKFYKAGFFVNYKTHQIEIWANCKFDVEREIFKNFPKATGIDVWLP